MCVYSLVLDSKMDDWQRRYPQNPVVQPVLQPGLPPYPAPSPLPSQQELEEFRRLLERAREYDKRNNEPACEEEQKRQKIKDLARKLGVDISFV